MQKFKVIVVGGAPGAGKSTLAAALAARLNFALVSMDDLYTAAKALTSPATHPPLHVMRRLHHHEYFTTTSVKQLVADAMAEHTAMWPAIAAVITRHATSGPSMVIEGWFVTPSQIASLALDTVSPLWLSITREALVARERANVAFFEQAAKPETMFRNVIARSLWHNARVTTQAQALGQRILVQDGTVSVNDLCEAALA